MTISARRVALLGIGFPLSAIMLAVLGLWPEEEDEAAEPIIIFGGGGGKRQHDGAKRLLANQQMQYKQNQALIAMIVAMAEEQEFA